MTILDTGKAIQRVSELICDQANRRLEGVLDGGGGIPDMVRIGRPQPRGGVITDEYKDKLYIFLYEASFDPTLRNAPLAQGEQPPLWFVLKYIMTAFDGEGYTDTAVAHGYLGEGVRALQELAYLPLTISSVDALGDNPQSLKITFDEMSADLLSKLMQGPDEIYRFSMAFQVRPVMIRTREQPSYSLLVGVDYNAGGNIIGEEGIHIDVLPSLGPRITGLSPAGVEPGKTLEISGSGLDLSGPIVQFGPVELDVVSQRAGKLVCKVNGTIAEGQVISAGSHPISIYSVLPNGRRRFSNLIVGRLLPVLATAIPDGITSSNPAVPGSAIVGHIDFTGTLLGTENDDILAALYKDGAIVKVFESLTHTSMPPLQTKVRLAITDADKIAPDNYRVIYRVNGEQAKNSPMVELIP